MEKARKKWDGCVNCNNKKSCPKRLRDVVHILVMIYNQVKLVFHENMGSCVKRWRGSSLMTDGGNSTYILTVWTMVVFRTLPSLWKPKFQQGNETQPFGRESLWVTTLWNSEARYSWKVENTDDNQCHSRLLKLEARFYQTASFSLEEEKLDLEGGQAI